MRDNLQIVMSPLPFALPERAHAMQQSNLLPLRLVERRQSGTSLGYPSMTITQYSNQLVLGEASTIIALSRPKSQLQCFFQ